MCHSLLLFSSLPFPSLTPAHTDLDLRLQLQADLREDAHEELVDVVVQGRRRLGVLGLVRVRNSLRIWTKCQKFIGYSVSGFVAKAVWCRLRAAATTYFSQGLIPVFWERDF